MSNDSTGPLTGVRVLDMTRVLAGPFATMLLADMGADVIKVERPGPGDDTRAFGPPFVEGESTYFMSINRGKRSIVIDLKSDEGRHLLRSIAGKSDVLVENFRAGVLERAGLGCDELHAEFPRLIYASISGFGQQGLEEYVKAPGYDLLVQSLSGVVSLTGHADGSGTKAGVSIGDLVGGLYCVQGVLAALFEREKTGRGQRVDISMLDGLVSLLTYHAGNYLATGNIPHRMGTRHPSICPFEVFSTADGQLAVCCGNDAQFSRLAHALGLSACLSDARFQTNAARVQHRDALIPQLETVFAQKTSQEWIDRLGSSEVDVPCASVQDVAGALSHPQLRARGLIQSVQHPKAGSMEAVGSPVRIGRYGGFSERPAPLLGQHTAEVLEELGLTSPD